MPPLRERGTDVPLLVQHFLEKFARPAGAPPKRLSSEARALLSDYPWPGNVRELEHVIERAVALSSGDMLTPDDLPSHLHGEPERAPRLPASRMTLEQVKRWYVSKVLEETGGNKLRAAEVLGIDRSTLYRMLERGESEDEVPEDEV